MKTVKRAALSIAFLPVFLFARDSQLDNIDIYLHTVDRGTLVYNNFGHTAVRVHNRSNGTDVVFNWGIFDFRDPVEFSLKFYKGILIYKLGVYPYENALSYYQSEGRTVWEDKINFSNKEKEIFLNRLQWNNLPENRDYQYHYFFNNCSTKVRDYFNEALNNSLEPEFKENSAERTYRATVREGYNTNPEIYFSLDLLMNGNIDSEMSQWNEMFLPLKLRQHLLNYSKEKPFFSESKVLYEFKSPAPSLLSGFQIFSLIMVILLGGIYIGSLRKIKALEKTCWFISFILILLLGIFGLTMLLNWIISGHIDLHHNLNLLLLWPCDLLLLWPVLMIAIRGQSLKISEKTRQIWNSYINIHLMLNCLFLLLWITGLSTQNITNTAFYICPVFSLLLLLIKRAVKADTLLVDYGIQ